MVNAKDTHNPTIQIGENLSIKTRLYDIKLK